MIYPDSTRRRYADPRPDAPYAALVHMADAVGNVTQLSAHGTRGRYERHGCRCDQCKAWKRSSRKAAKP